MLRALVTLILFGLANIASAQCLGTDLRHSLPAELQKELAARLAQTPFAEGNHWMARRDGQLVHLIGTVHIDDPRLDAPFERLRPILEAANRILLEVTPDEEAALHSALSTQPELLLLTDTTLPELLPEEDWQALSHAASARGLPPILVSKYQPWYLATLLSIPPCAMSTLTGGVAGMDGRIATFAQENGKELLSLEPFDTGMRAFGEMSRDDQIDMLMSSIVPNQTAEDMFATLLATYFEERHAEAWEVMRELSVLHAPNSAGDNDPALDKMERALLATRNQAWIPVITAAAAKGGLTVAAFGAAHLSGPDGVLALLQARGFALERQQF